MRFSDLLKLANQNNKAGKKFFVKIIIGTSIIFLFLVSVISVWFYYKDYITQYENKYKDCCYIYSDLETVKQYELSVENKELEDLIFDAVGTGMELGKVEFEIDGKIYNPRKIYVPDSSRYYDLNNNFSELKLRKGTDSVTDKYFLEGRNSSDSGTIVMDDYLLSVLGITDYESVLNKKINIVYDGREVISDYVITGIFDVTMYDDAECEDYHDYHYEHVYINLKDNEKYSTYGNNRYYFSSYKNLMKSYEYTSDFILSGEYIDDKEYDCFVPAAAYEICISTWFMDNFGKGILLLLLIISFAIVYSICYYLKSYYDRNKSYINMLHNIGMTKKNIKLLHNIELLIMVIISILIAAYLSIILLSIFSYITNKYLAIGYSINVASILLAVLIGIVIMFILKNVAQSDSKK